MWKHLVNCKVRAQVGNWKSEVVREEFAEDEYHRPRQHSAALWSGKTKALYSWWEAGGDWWTITQDLWLVPCQGAACRDGGAQRLCPAEPQADAIQGMSH